MALSTARQRASFPLAVYNFRVTVGGVAMRFARVNGLVRQYRTLTHRHGLSFAEGEQIVRYHLDAWAPVTLEQGTVQGSQDLLAWLQAGDRRPMQVELCDAEGLPAVTWRIAHAVPVKLTAPSFDAKSNDASVDTLEVQASGIAVVHTP
jgi:phage tail-like protein